MPATRLLDVPFLPQSELLCGGAALAMVERWWGRRGVYAEDFVGLVRPEVGGIRTTDLEQAARGRGWTVTAFDGTSETVRQFLEARVPVVVLLEVAPGRFHYVVLLGWADGRVSYHDPARGPSRSADEQRFLAEWSGAERWAMVLRPGAPRADSAASVAATTVPTDSLPCRPWLDRGLDAAAADHLDEAADLLSEARLACPAEPLVLRELAGIRFKQRRLPEAVRLAEAYLTQAPGDANGWQLLAASEYLTGDRDGALRAWNQLGRPTVDLVRVDGVHEVRFGMIADAIEAPPGSVLTPSQLALARRRVSDVPALRRARVEYRPVGGGLVEVQVAVAERPVLGNPWRLAAGGALQALTQHEVGIAIATPTGAGELWSATWRWEPAHPRVAIRVDMPLRLGIIGVVGVQGSWDRYRFAIDSATSGSVEESRRAEALGFGGWITPSLRPVIGLRLEHWSGGRAYLAAHFGTEFRAAADRFSLSTSLEHGQAFASRPSYMRGNVRALWTSAAGLQHPAWSVRLGVDETSRRTPLGLWPVASADLPWALPLRAHPRTSNDRLPGATAGRTVLHGGLSGDHPVYRAGPLTFAVGAFLDGARIGDPASGSRRDRLYLDAGGGLRIAIGDGSLGVLRIDLATGLTDRSTALSVGLQQSWPPFREFGNQ